MTKKIILHFCIFIAVIAFLWGLLIASACIPNSSIKENLLESAVYYGDKEPFEFSESGSYNSVADNYADSILLNVLWNIRSSSPVASSIDTKYYDGEDYGENWGLYQTLNGTAPNTDYTRYWHGSVAFIRPLLVFTDVNGIKLISFTALLVLIAATEAILIKRKHFFAAAALAVSLVGIQFWNISLSLEYIPAFMVCFTLCPIYIFLEKKGDLFLTLLSVAGGTMIAFFDFLTVETITLLLPLTIVFTIRADDERLGSFRENLMLLIKCGVCWGTAYIMTFIVKWTAATVISGENKFKSAFSAAAVRLYGAAEEADISTHGQASAAVAANISTLFGGTERISADRIIIGILITAVISGVILFLFGKKKINASLTLTMLVISVIPYLRYMVLNNHSYLHEFFTYRAQITVILCLCSMLWYNIELKKRR